VMPMPFLVVLFKAQTSRTGQTPFDPGCASQLNNFKFIDLSFLAVHGESISFSAYNVNPLDGLLFTIARMQLSVAYSTSS
jgi:hypothetical protein